MEIFRPCTTSTWKYPQKQIVAFIGPSGCGKSYFPQDLKPDEMTWWKDAGLREKFFWIIRDIYKDIDVIRLRQRVGMVFQQPNPFPMSIYDNVAYGPRIHGIKKKSQLDEIVERSLRQAAIWDEVKDRLKKNAVGVSGGQQQRICIARALAVGAGSDPDG